ncbi:MAG TPA: FtsX-like permease family protein [Anaerolineaceae bacterium]|nr:FtsX-like permease family protein [Anaerolineaceae bacterium]
MSFLRQLRILTLRSIRARSARFILSAFGIVLGVAVMLAIEVTNKTALNSIKKLFENTSGRTNLAITSSALENTSFSDSIVRTVTNIPGVRVAAPIVKASTFPASTDESGELLLSIFGQSSSGSIQIHGINPEQEILFRDYTITFGKFLSNDLSAREIVLVESYAEDQELETGDWFPIVTPNGVEELKIVGVMSRDGPGQTNNGAFGVIPLVTAQEFFNRQGQLDQVDILTNNTNPVIEELERLKKILQQRLGKDFSITFPSSQGDRMSKMLQNYQIGLNFMSGIALFVGAFLIYNAFAMTVVERTREFGMLRTVGMTRAQVTRLILLEAVVVGILGALAGLGVGILLSRGLTNVMELILNQQLGKVEIPANDLLSSWGIGLFVTIMAAGIPALQAGRISPMEALRIRGKSKEPWLIRHGWKVGIVMLAVSTFILIANPFSYDLQFRMGSITMFTLFGGATLLIPSTVTVWERFSRPVMEKLYGTAGSLGSRNVRRSRQRTTLTVAALMIGVAMVIITRAITGSFSGDLRAWMSAYIGGDIFAGSSVPMRSDIGRRIEAVSGVNAVAPIRYLEVDWETPSGIESINFMAIDPVAYTKVTKFVFSDPDVDSDAVVKRLVQGDAVLLSSVLAEKYNLAPGDSVYLRTRGGFRAFEIVAIVVDFYNSGMVVQGSFNDMRRYFRINNANTFLIKIDEGQDVDVVLKRIDDLYGKRYHLTFETNKSIRARALTLMEQAFSMFDVLALIAVVVGSLGVVNTLTMSVIERNQEIGMLRAIGVTRSQVVRMVLAEAALMGVIGGALGIVTGLIMSRIIFIGMTSMSGYQLNFVLPTNGAIVAFIAAIIISQLAAVFPARRAASIRILEAVHYE